MIFHGYDPVWLALMTGAEEGQDPLAEWRDPWPALVLAGLCLAAAAGLAALAWGGGF